MTKQYPPIKLKTADDWHEDQCYVCGSDAWLVQNIWEAAKDLPTYEVPLVGMCLDIAPWGGSLNSFLDFLSHVRLINDAEMRYPIILDPDGNIADGRHRLAKAIVTGRTTVKIKRLPFMPDPDFTNMDGEDSSVVIGSFEED